MFEHLNWITLIIALTALTVAPGADTVLVLRNAARRGSRDGIITAFGICSGLFFHAAISAAGISALLLASTTLFTAVKLAGAVYLVWLGLQSLWAAFKGAEGLSGAETVVTRARPSVSFREGVLSNVLNPKPIVFYMAFLPQFISPAHSALTQALFIAGLHFVLAMVFLSLIAMAVERARNLLQRPMVQQGLDAVTGTILIGFGVSLFYTAR